MTFHHQSMSHHKQHRIKSEKSVQLPADIDWKMLDKSKFFILGAALFSGVSGTLYPVMVLKTRQQVYSSACSSSSSSSSWRLGCSILKQEGVAGFYRGFPTTLMGTIPARVLYMTTLEMTKTVVSDLSSKFGLQETTAAAVANSTAGLAASLAAQLVWTPVDVISQRLMVQKKNLHQQHQGLGVPQQNVLYKGGMDAFRCIRRTEGLRGLYRGFGLSIVTYAPSNALWWGSYCLVQRTIWQSLGYCGRGGSPSTSSSSSITNSQSITRSNLCTDATSSSGSSFITRSTLATKSHGHGSSSLHQQGNALAPCPPSTSLIMGVQGASAAGAAGVTAILTTPLDTIKTRLQVMQGSPSTKITLRSTLDALLREGGWKACYRGLGPRWAMMVMSAITMITTYESLKRLSKKKDLA